MIKKLHRKTYQVIKKIEYNLRGRHIILVLEKNGRKYLYKELIIDDDSRFHEQIDFQKRVEENKTNIILPRLFDYELKTKNKWGLWEYLSGKHLAEWRPKNITDFQKWLKPIVDLLIEMEKIPPFKQEIDIVDHLIERVNQWSQEPLKAKLYPETVKKKVIKFIKKNRQYIEVGFNHSDLVPWHMHEIRYPKFAIVDYENCKNKPKYYDLAYFYHRTYTKLAEPKLADNFLEIYKKKANLPSDFEKRFLPVLGQRIIGGLFDHLVNKDRTDIRFHQKLLKWHLNSINLVK